MGSKGKLKGVRICNNCSKLILIRHKERMNRAYAFCCKKCEGEYIKKITNFKHKPNCICEQCGKVFYKKLGAKKSKHNFCSKDCHYEFKKESFKGENNHQYGLKGSKNASWKSDEKITYYGYKKIRVLDHPFKDCDGFVFEHRLVAEEFLLTDENSIEIDGKKYLRRELVVHHIDENKLNNNPSNLKIMSAEEHMSYHKGGEYIFFINTCKHCHKTFTSKKKKIFCSQKCRDEYNKSNEVEKICPVCHTKFKTTKKASESRICCSIECSNKLRNRETIECQCDNCNKPIIMKKSRYNKSKNHFCSHSCSTSYRNKHKSKTGK